MTIELTHLEDAVTNKMEMWIGDLAGSLNPNNPLDFAKLKDENKKLKEILNPISIKDGASFVTLSERLHEVDVGFHILKKISSHSVTYLNRLKSLVSYVDEINSLSELDLDKIQEYRGILVDIVSDYLSLEDSYLLDKH